MTAVRILFVMRHSGFVRNFESVIDELAARGHHVHLAFELPREQAEVAQALAERHSSVTFGTAPVRTDRWTHLAYDLRAGLDALRYRGVAYANAPKLRERGLRSAPLLVRWLSALPPLHGERGLSALSAALQRMLAAIPRDASIDAYLADLRPDMVLVTPLVAGPTQDDLVRSARALGTRTVLPVTSWDNLTNKGLIREPVDAVLVWNEAQRREAIAHHGVPPALVQATGAHTYDHWFGWECTTDRDEFCRRVGLPPDRPIVLYLCSSKFIAPDEPPFVRRWLEQLREAPSPLREAAVLVRPHPATGPGWAGIDLADLGPAAIWPPTGADPRTDETKAGYYDSMYHSEVAVGINTSALIELAIVGRRAFTVLDPQFRDTQQGTLHFSHLTESAGGILTVAANMDEHHRQLSAALLRGRDGVSTERFLRAFIRPHGLERPAAPLLVDAVERVTTAFPAHVDTATDRILRQLLLPLTIVAHKSGRKQPWSKRRRRWARRRAKQRQRLLKRLAGLRAGRLPWKG